MKFYVKDLEVIISFWFFAVLAFFLALDKYTLPYYFLLPVLAHELGHIAAILISGVKIKSIKLTAFGANIKKAGFLSSYPKEIAIAAAGVFTNAALALGFYFFAPKTMRALLFAASNTAVAAFNALPVGSLDGGEIIKLLSQRFFNARTAYMLSRLFSFIALVPLFALSFYLILRPGRNFTPLAVAVYLMAEIIRES